MDKSATVPLEISSRSDRVRTRLDLLRRGERMPPVGANMLKIEEEGRSNNRPIEVRDSPLFQRSHISCFYAQAYLIRVLYAICNTPSFYLRLYCYVNRLRTPSIADAILKYYSKRLEDISFALWVLISRVQRNPGEGRRGAPLKGSRREKSLLAIEVGTPRIESLGGKFNPLEVAVPVRIFSYTYSNPHAKSKIRPQIHDKDI